MTKELDKLDEILELLKAMKAGIDFLNMCTHEHRWEGDEKYCRICGRGGNFTKEGGG